MKNHFDWIQKWSVYSPDKVAVREAFSERSYTYAQLNDLSERLATYLTDEKNLKKGDRLAILAENCIEYILLYGAAVKTGVILVPLNYRLIQSEIAFLLQNSEANAIVAARKFKDRLPQARTFIDIDDIETIARQHKRKDSAHFAQEEDLLFILYTSGTTGFPKGAMYTYKMLFWNSINTAMSLIVNTESRTINVMPFFHTGGWNVLTTPFLHHGGYTCLMKNFDPAEVNRLLESEEVTIFMGVPTMLKMMAEDPSFDHTDFSSIEYFIVGGEAMPIPLIETWNNKGVAIRQGYGMTEVGPNLTSLHQDDVIRKIGSIGRENFYVDIKIDGPLENGERTGELLLKGPMVTPGYWKNEAATANNIVDGWFCSGDRVRQDAAGYLYVVDRIKNMYISGGENVYPAEIERVLLKHQGIKECCVVPQPDEKWGESGVAFYSGTAAIAPDELKAYCTSHLAKFKVPKTFIYTEVIPKNDAGKIDRKKLKEIAAEK